MNVSKILFIALVILLFSQENAISQKNKPTKKDKDETTVITFGEEESSTKSKDKVLGSAQIIKTSPLSWIFGAQSVEYERQINDWLSVQCGIGLTFSGFTKDLYNALLADFKEENGYSFESPYWTSDIYDDFYDYSFRKSRIGYLLNASARFYLSDDALEGSYIAPLFTYSRYNYHAEKVAPNSSSIIRISDSYDKESVRNISFEILYGYQVLYSKLSLDYFIGLGVKNEKFTRQDLGYENDGTVGSVLSDGSTRALSFSLGLRLGYQL